MDKSVQPGRNGGTLKVGNPGNKGGGRIPSKVREMCAKGFADAVPEIIKIARGKVDGVAPNEQVSAFDKLGKYGIGEVQSVALENGDWLSVVAEVMSKHFETAEGFDACWQELIATLSSMK